MRRIAFILLAIVLALSHRARATIFGSIEGIVHDPQHRPEAAALAGERLQRAGANSAFRASALVRGAAGENEGRLHALRHERLEAEFRRCRRPGATDSPNEALDIAAADPYNPYSQVAGYVQRIGNGRRRYRDF